MSYTPLYDAVIAYCQRDMSRFHTPGHGGISLSSFRELSAVTSLDVTEIPGLDSLYEAEGPLQKMEENYRHLYKSKGSFASAGGSTLCVQTMLSLMASPGETVAVERGAHASVLHTMALLDITPVWIWPMWDKKTGLAQPVTSSRVEKTLKAHPEVKGVFLTSPDYYGQNAPVAEIAQVCRQWNIPLGVDAAHGAHYPWLEKELFLEVQQADLVCHSLHKTLPALTGAAMLHVNNAKYLENAKQHMALFGSTSPSYLILLSIDLLVPFLLAEGEEKMRDLTRGFASLQNLAEKKGFLTPQGSSDPARLTLGFGAAGFTQQEFYELLQAHTIEPEYMDDYYAVFIGSLAMEEKDTARLEELLLQVEPKPPRPLKTFEISSPPVALSLQKAMFSRTKTIPTLESVGEICGAAVSPCPPGIPLLMPGEQMTESLAKALWDYGVFSINVLQ